MRNGLLGLLLAFISSAEAAANYCRGTSFCVYGVADGTGYIIFTIHSASAGWAAIGFGSQMAGSPMYVGWKNTAATQGYTISTSFATGQNLPKTDNIPQSAVIVSLNVAAPTWAKLAFSFKCPITSQGVTITASQNYIIAWSSKVPNNPALYSSKYSRHDGFYSFSDVDFTVLSTNLPVASSGNSASNIESADSSIIAGNLTIPAFVGSQSVYCEGSHFCAYAMPDESGNLIFTIHSSSTGWAAIGLGQKMTGTPMYVGWKNTAEALGYTVASSYATGQAFPRTSNIVQSAVVVALNITAPIWAQLAFSFKCPITAQGVTITASQSYIIAWSNLVPNTPTLFTSTYSKHDGYSAFTGIDYTRLQTNYSSGISNGTIINFSHPVARLTNGWTYNQILLIHGVLMFFSWAVLPFIAIFFARYLKYIGHSWYQLHFSILGFGTMGLTFIGILLIALYKAPPHFQTWHEGIGIFILVALTCQVILGFIINYLWDSQRTARPWWDKLHAWLGRVMLLLALINIFLGFRLYQENYEFSVLLYFGFFIWICFAAGMFYFAGAKFGMLLLDLGKGHLPPKDIIAGSAKDLDMNLNKY